MLVSLGSEGHQYGGRKVQETAVVEAPIIRDVITRGKLYTLGNTSLNVRSVPKVKTFKKVIFSRTKHPSRTAILCHITQTWEFKRATLH